MLIYERKEQCNGCRACEQICPRNCIRMTMDEEGFYYPEINSALCVNCGLCRRVCREVERKRDDNYNLAYAVRNRNDDIRMRSSSGGVFYELARSVIEMGGCVFGAAFDEDFNVCHIGVESVEGLELLMGSKYVQSNTRGSYQEVDALLKSGRYCLYSGTPCQIAGLKAYLGREEERLICVSVICHGVPSPEVWRRYLLFLKGRYGEDKIKSVSFREKWGGWRHFSMRIEFENNVYSEYYSDDLFVAGFLQNMYLRPSCYGCRVKGAGQQADIILGDYWGVEEYHPQIDDRRGTSAVIINSEKGKRLFDKIKGHLECVSSEYQYIQKKNITLENSVRLTGQRRKFYESFRETGQIDTSIQATLVNKTVSRQERCQYQYPFVLQYLENKIQGKEIWDFLADAGFYNIAVYAVTEWTKMLCDDLSGHEEETQIVCVCDKRHTEFPRGIYGKEVVGIEEMVRQYEQGKVDGIVVCSVFHENEIICDLLEKGVRQQHIVSVISAIYHV